ncbi:MAG: translocation/assembly module TamB [Gemmatimonadaceae bacterium]|nr:translocation/assembly module TamB [Gemmatimonadaceae bacterium]
MSRRQRIVFKSAFVLVGGLALMAVLVISATQTSVGQNQVRKLVTSFLADNVQGKVYLGRIHGGLLSGMTIDSLEIRDKEDTLFVATGPVRVKYDLRDLLDKRLLLRYVEIDHPVLYIREHPDGHWNWRKIFPEKPAGPKSQARSFGEFIVIDSARVNNLTFTLTLRWHPADWFKGYRRDSVISAALAHPTEEFRRVGTGFTRTWRFTEGNVRTGYIRLADPDSVGRFVRIADASMIVKDPPFRFTKVAANVKQNGDSIWFDAPRMSLPASHGKAAGKLVWGSGLPLRYAIHVNADRVAMADIAWIYPTLPKTGNGSLDLEIVSEKNPHIIDYRITNMDVRTIKSRLLGSMTYAVGGEILGVRDVDLVADPVDFDLLRTLNGKPYPYDWQGKLTGTIIASGGPLTRFVVDESDITFSDAHVPGAISKFSGRGELDILFPAFTVFHGFNVDLEKLDIRTLQYLNPLFPKLKGTLSGSARLDSSWLDVRFSDADILHHDADAPVSRVTGKGRVIWGEKFLTYDVDLQGQPIYLTTLARSYPVLPLRGEVSGPIRIRGTSENLQIVASMNGPSGAFTFDGYVDADPPAYSARGRGTVAGLDMKTLVVGKAIPDTRLNGRYAIDILGATAEDLKGRIDADLDRSVVEGIPVESATGRFAISNGVAQIDTLKVRGTGLRGEASGTYAIAPSRNGSLKFDFALDSVGAAKPYLRAAGIKIADADTLTGTVRLFGEVTGQPGRLLTHAVIESEKFAFGGRGAGQLRADITIGDSLTGLRNTVARVSGANVSLGRLLFGKGEAIATIDSAGSSVLSATLTSENGIRTEVRGTSRMLGDTTFLRIDTLRVTGDVIGTYANEAVMNAQLTTNGARLDSLILAHPTNGKLAIRGVRFEGDSIRASVRTEGVDLALVSAFTPAIGLARGAVRANMDISGTTSQPKIEGEFRIENGSATATAFGTRLEKINADIALTNDTVFVRRLSAETVRENQGRVSVEGYIGLQEYKNPIFSLSLNATDFHAIEKPGLASLDISTTTPVTLTGPYDGAVVRGSVRVDRGSIFIPELVQKRIVDLRDPEFAEFVDTLLVKDRKVLPTAPSAFTENLSLENLALDLGPDVWLRSSEANIQLGGSLNVTSAGGSQRNERTQLALEGTLNTIKGTYRLNLVDPFVQPTFDVESGALRFFGTPDLNPSLDIKAIHTVRQARQSITGRDVRVRVNIGGTLAEPKLALDNPDNLPLSESDLLSYLITGEQGFALDNTRSQYGSQLASAAVRYGGTLLTNAIPRGLLDIVELQTPRLGSDVYAPGSSDYYLALLNTRAILGKQIGQRWFLGLSTGFCVVNSTNFVENLGLKLEYRFNAMYTVEGGIEPGTSDKTCTRSSVGTFQQTPSQRGFDFFRTWRF